VAEVVGRRRPQELTRQTPWRASGASSEGGTTARWPTPSAERTPQAELETGVAPGASAVHHLVKVFPAKEMPLPWPGDGRRLGSGQRATFTGACETGLGRVAGKAHSKRVDLQRRDDGTSEGTVPLGRHGKTTSVSRLRQESHPGALKRGPGAEADPPQRCKRREPLAPPARKRWSLHETWVLVLKTENVWVADVDRACLSAVRRARLRSGTISAV
jgi:hypothetical protein